MSIPRSRHALVYLALLAVALPAILVYAILAREALNLPILDDYGTVIDFANTWHSLPSAGHKLLYIAAAQQENYKFVFEHLCIGLQLALTHRINFLIPVLCGNLLLLPIAFVLWKTCFATEPDLLKRLVLFLPVSFLLFELNYAETLDFTTSSLQHVAVIACAFPALYLLAQTTRASIALACLAAALACAASPNGFFLAPIGLLLLLPTRNYKKMFLWLTPFPFLLAIYFYHFTQPNNATSVPFFWKPIFFLSFLGSGVENMHHLPIKNLSIVLGLFFCGVLLHAVKSRYDRANPVAFFTTLWMILTALLVSAVRVQLGLQQSLSGRYKIYCDLLLIFSYVYLAERLRRTSLPPARRRLLYAAVAAAIILFSLAADAVGYRFLEKRRQRILLGMRQYVANPALTPMLNPNEVESPDMLADQEAARLRLTQALHSGVYTLPALDK